MLLKLQQLLTADQLAQVLGLIAQAPWIEGTQTAGTQSAQVKNNLQLDEQNPYAQSAQTIVLQALAQHAQFFSAALPKRVFPPLFNRYQGDNNSFGNHIDNAVRTPKLGGPWVRTDLSCTVFLSDPQTYDGGALVIEDHYGSHEIKLAAGDAVLYPSTSVHRVEPVTRGERLASFFWIESMVREESHRRILFDLDQSVIALRAEQGDTPLAVKLTGTYHNMLRLWVDVN